jgi:peptide/nickel transport system substrate-binding protein
MTADDLVFTWDLWRDPHAPFPVGDTVKSVESVRKADARTVVVRHPHPTIRANLDWLGAFPAVVPKHVVEPMVRRVGIVRFAQIPYGQDPQATIGAGPFVLKSWTKGNEMVFEANPGYHLGRPVLDRVVFRFFSDANTLVANFAAGSLDAASPAPGGIPLAQALEIEGLLKQQRMQGYTVSYTPAPASETYFTNLENPHLRDKRVRQALLYASNREGIVQAIFNGRVPVAHSFVPPNHPWYLKDIKKYPYDPAKARQLLDEAGFRAGPDGIRRNAAGERLSLIVTAPAGDKTRERVEQILQQQWKDAGIELVIANKPIRTILAEIWSFRTRPPDFINFTLAVDDLHDIDFNWASWNIAPVGQRSNLNVSGFRNAEADQILRKYETTLDRGQRKVLYAEFQRLWAEEVPDFLLYNNSGAAVRRDGFIDLRPVGLAYTPGYWTWNARRWRWAR